MSGRAWDRRSKESVKAFAAFRAYRDLGAERSIRRIGRETGKDRAQLERWSVKWDWVERCAKWDAELDRRRLNATARAVEEMRERHIEAAGRLQTLGLEELEKVAKAQRAKGADRLTIDQILRLVREGSTMERLNRGEPGTIAAVTGDGDRDLSVLSDEELLEMKRLNDKAAGRRET